MNAGYLRCKECNKGRDIPEKFLDISCQVEGYKGVHEALDAYYAGDDIEDYHCETCDAKRTVTKGAKLARCPPVLQISLNRTKYDM